MPSTPLCRPSPTPPSSQAVRTQKDAAATLYEAMAYVEAEAMYTAALAARTNDQRLRAQVPRGGGTPETEGAGRLWCLRLGKFSIVS